MNRHHPYVVAIAAVVAAALLQSCGRHKEPSRTPQMPPEAPPSFAGLRVVNDEPFADMYFKSYGVNPTIDTAEESVSTFSVDVDTAAYTMVRSYLERGVLPPDAAVRVEEVVNAFDYGYERSRDEAFALSAEAFPSPSRRGYHVLHLGIAGRQIPKGDRKPASLVFVIDVSGSMDMEGRLGLVKSSLDLLVAELSEGDRVGIVTYGDQGRVVLESMPAGSEAGRTAILDAIRSLASSGSTNVQEGLALGYAMAGRHLLEGGTNRIILCSDGVANNGVSTSADGIFETVKDMAGRGITLTTVGFGMGNYNDVLMERLAVRGSGAYAYVDRLAEARRIFVEQMTGTLEAIASDVKVQVEFDPASVLRYRLLGYENRRLETEDFADDAVDAAEVGAGHAVTALYEIKLAGEGGDLGTLRLRFKEPRGGASRLIEKRLPAAIVRRSWDEATPSARLSVVASSFAEKLRGSYWVRDLTYRRILELFDGLPAAVRDRAQPHELRGLVARAEALDRRPDRYASAGTLEQNGFDRVPVLR